MTHHTQVDGNTRQRAKAAYVGSQKGTGVAKVATLRDALIVTNRIILHAATLTQPAHAWITCCTLNSELRDRVTKDVTGITFGDAVRTLIEHGGNCSLLLWNDLEQDRQFSPSLAKLLFDQWDGRLPSNAGRLTVRATGHLPELTQKIMHFAAATDAQHKHWFLRVEKPHPPSALNGFNLDTELPAAVGWDDSDAREYGKKLIKGFDRIFNAAGVRARRQQPNGMFFIPEPSPT